jgi:flagellar hook-associated protein 1 FlgK
MGSILSIATTALRTQQEAINITAHNIANASTEGYSRQRPVLSALTPLRTPTGVFGTGVVTNDVQQIRDIYLDSAYRSEIGAYSEEGVRSNVLGQVETLLAEPGNGGLSTTLDQFFSAWSALATDPNSSTARGAVKNQAEALTDQLNGLASDLDALRQDTEARLQSSVDRVNTLAEEIARYNREVVAAESTGETAGDLRDARNRAIDELATLLPVQVTDRENGSVGVLSAGLSLVDGATYGTLEVRNVAGSVGVALTGQPNPLRDVGSGIGGMLTVLNEDIPQARGALDRLTAALVTDINALHQTGTNANGDTGVDFFDPTKLTADSISVSAAVLADPDAVAAGTPDVTGAYRAGANDVALALADLRDGDSPTLGTSFSEHFRKLATDIGFSVRSSLDQMEVHRTLSDQADLRRTAYNGVSTDEELVRLIEFQTAYSAAARVVTTANEMLETLVRM